MAKLKLTALPDDKPVKVTVELPATVHRDLVAYAEILAHAERTADQRAHQTDRANACAIHGDGPGVREIPKVALAR